MNKEEKVFMEEYDVCCKDLAIKIRKLEKHILIEKEKIGICGVLERSIYNYVSEVFIEFQNNIVEIMNKLEKEFQKSLKSSFLENFKNENTKVIEGNYDSVNKIIKESKLRISETTQNSLRVLKENIIINSNKKIIERNESIKRIRKLEKSKNGFISQLINGALNKIGDWIILAILLIIIFVITKFVPDNQIIINFLEKIKQFIR